MPANLKRTNHHPGGVRRPPCQGTSRTTGQPCKKTCVPGRRFCRFHGGHTKCGPDHPNWKDGRYSTVLPMGDLRDSFKSYMQSPELLSLVEDIGVMSARQEQVIQELNETNPAVGQELRSSWRAVVDAVAAGDGDQVAGAMKAHGRLVEAAYARERTWERFYRATEEKRKLVETEGRRRAREIDTLDARQALQFQQQVAAITAAAAARHNGPPAMLEEMTRMFGLMNEGIGISEKDLEVIDVKVVKGRG